ncbi:MULTISPECIES: GNAT family N-acetyltransferase [unclassified Pseudoalteromonas]|uniref:GNAT family N-acetyltransferase n=1 Tax=unclassified Pseudoalteromonas TaxID=194690 RepID=UPI000B3CE244|nr:MULTISPECIES: GNAT family N-acetyltransferase [unclassified Pseudoalteromonas]MDN3377400.1 GNAT family N-acetyltransferase [Pseudoalteromonas sp. APC 3893]MDN3385433.1 GNAT family N-acetyltransferase [Pseudoalteromonas sp. APC 4017]OUS72376.1 GNAT family N-acetyltransferase [Pseudoalteromonas sp. A601]
MSYHIDKVEWNTGKDLLQQIRERVFVCELHIPKHVEFDSLDYNALHVLVTDDCQTPVATGRLCSDGLIGRIAVLPEHRNRSVYKSLLTYIVNLAHQQGYDSVSINCILNEVERFKRNGFEQQGVVFMEAGIPRQRMQCPISQFDTEPFTLVH